MADVPRAHDFEAFFCKDPKCGLHIVPYTKEGEAICIIIISADETLGLIEFCQKHLRQRNANRTTSSIPDNRRRYPAPDDQRLGPEVPFAERFNAFVGSPPIEYLGRWRMQLAARLLDEGVDISEAAAAVGYTSPATFCRAFKRFVGTPPGAWRRAKRIATL